MRTLLLDNHDSYTYNLFQLIAAVQGVEPVVMTNDAPEGPRVDLDGFDSIVISPGPGHPGNGRDFGFATRVLAESPVPVLGVCLGHQGLALLEGGQVAAAPAPRHGHLARIRHDGQDLFHGLPQEFTAVRYHSLCVHDPLPSTLAASAWADDGVVMGLRHLSRPLWGVQFHPESVLSEHGHRLLANFRDLARRRRSTGRPAITVSRPPGTHPLPRRAPGAALAVDPPPPVSAGYRLHTRRLPFAVNAEAAFTRRFAAAPYAFWLDSSRVEPGLARFSFLGDGTGPLSEFVSYDVDEGAIHVQRSGEPARQISGSVLDYLRRELARRAVDDRSLPFDFTCGYVGYFGYEMKAECGSPNRRRASTPDAGWLFADRVVAIDHADEATYLLCLAEATATGDGTAAGWLEETATFLSAMHGEPAAGRPGRLRLVPRRQVRVERWLARDRDRYLADIAACQRELRAGESYEICLTNTARLPAGGDPFGYYRLLRRHNPAPYAAFLRFGEVAVACSSPERFLTIARDHAVETKPIKGTVPRGAGPTDDERLRAALAADPKTRAENLMIVDLLRNDLGRVCEVGTVEVPKLMATETYATVHQLVSTVRGRLRFGTDAIGCIRACFPGGSMTGAPKPRTLEIIDKLENEARGIYSGTVGFLSCNGTADLNIVIRTAVFVGDRMHLGAGGAIVLGSDPVAEYDEMLLKMAAPMRAYAEWRSISESPPARRRPAYARPRPPKRAGRLAPPRREAS